MDLKETLKKINKDREKKEACFVFACWGNPDLYSEYKDININGDKTLRNEDAKFYWNLGRAMYEQGIRHFDAITLETFLSDQPEIKKKYDRYGGYQPIKDLEELIDCDNVASYYDSITKMNSLVCIAEKYEDLFNNKIEQLSAASNDDVYEIFEALNNSIAMSSSHGVEVEDLVIDEDFIESCKKGDSNGIYYGNACPILNYITLGLPLGDCYLISGASGGGKTSFAFENMAVALANNGTPVVVFSNEMKSKAYKHLLLIHILTHDLNYYKLTRKKLKIGKFSEEEEEMIKKAAEISQKKYNNIKFVKLFDNNTTILMQYMKKLALKGYKCFIWDTFKNDDISNGKEEWLQLLKNSRRVFNLVSKLDVSMVMTFQQALYTTNQRFLDASCLAGSKQVKEVVSELIMMRRLWNDEYTGEKNDCRAWRWDKEHNRKDYISLDPEKKYVVIFINKTRNDEDSNQIIYQWDAQWNKWNELGYCTIKNDHRGGSV